MKTIKLAIVDADKAYAKGLSEYLHCEYGQAFDISCFTNVKSLIEHLEAGQQMDILLIDQKLYNDSLSLQRVKTTIVLAENNLNSEVSGKAALYKYQLGERLAKGILEYYDSSAGEEFNINDKLQSARLIAVYSPAGGAGKSTIAYNLSRQYALQGKKIMLISMESFAALSIFKAETHKHGLSYLMYLISSNAVNLQVKLDAVLEFDQNTNIHYIPREVNSLEYKDDKQFDLSLLLEFLRTQSGYDTIIFDMDTALSDRLLKMFEHCDLILNVNGGDLYSKEKCESFNKQLNILNEVLGIRLADKTIAVNNKSASIQNGEADAGCIEIVTEIPYISNSSFMESGYYPEMTYFKQLYDKIEKFFSDKRGQV